MKLLFTLIFSFTTFLANAQICVGTAGQVRWQCWQNLYDDELGELSADERYPQNPDFVQTLYKLQSPVNFDNVMGARIRGFISVPVSDTVLFNITGDDITRFYLSPDTLPENKVLEAYTNAWTNIEEHDKYPEQTSAPIYLQSGQFYYFELIYIEGGGGDHVSLWWETDNENPNDWVLINNNYIHDVGCLPAACPPRNTPCDDGDSTTSNDLEDGFCNCVGQADTSAFSCVGERFKIKLYGYDSIPGSDLNDLYTDPDFPAMPHRGKIIHALAEKNQNLIDSTGQLVQAYLIVPVDGNYKFNITGNNECIFFLSSNHDPANKQAHQILVTGSTDPTEHDKYIYQSTSNIFLEKNKFYYIEINHKEGSWNEHFSIFWQTPFTPADTWKRIPEFYIYDYDCTMACIPQGTPCDDGDPFTNNDVYDANCECAGTPCSGSDCNDPLASYSPYPKCGLTDQLDNRADNNWLSCAISTNPNPSRAASHWIQYDFGEDFMLFTSHIWNYNEAGAFQQGFENVAIDYSSDGTNWTELNTYNWPLADGSSDYSGFTGPDFGGIEARYVLITSLDDPTIEPCRGFGKILINAEHCPNMGESCDDGNPYTLNDVINENCICAGVGNIFNDCLIDTLTLGDTLIIMDTLSAIELVQSSNTISSGNDIVMFVSGNEIDLNAGFEVSLGSNFEAFIELCNNGNAEDENETPVQKSRSDKPKDILSVSALPESDIQIIDFYLAEPGELELKLINKAGKTLYTLLDTEFINAGLYQKRLRTKKLEPGVYQVLFKNRGVNEIEKMTVTPTN